MRITRYLKQTAQWRKQTAFSAGWNAASYEPAQTIKVRKTKKVKRVKNVKEVTFVDVTLYMTEAPVEIGDQLDGEIIHASEHIVDISGKVIGRYAYPRPPVGFTP